MFTCAWGWCSENWKGVSIRQALRLGAFALRFFSGSSLGVRLFVHFEELLGRELGVLLSRREALVPEELLDGAEVAAVLEKVGREGVPQTVG